MFLTPVDRSEHVTALLDAAGELDQEGRAAVGLRRPLIATLAFAGLRLGELLALYWHDVHTFAGLFMGAAGIEPATSRV
jgi:hypothetical protein